MKFYLRLALLSLFVNSCNTNTPKIESDKSQPPEVSNPAGQKTPEIKEPIKKEPIPVVSAEDIKKVSSDTETKVDEAEKMLASGDVTGAAKAYNEAKLNKEKLEVDIQNIKDKIKQIDDDLLEYGKKLETLNSRITELNEKLKNIEKTKNFFGVSWSDENLSNFTYLTDTLLEAMKFNQNLTHYKETFSKDYYKDLENNFTEEIKKILTEIYPDNYGINLFIANIYDRLTILSIFLKFINFEDSYIINELQKLSMLRKANISYLNMPSILSQIRQGMAISREELYKNKNEIIILQLGYYKTFIDFHETGKAEYDLMDIEGYYVIDKSYKEKTKKYMLKSVIDDQILPKIKKMDEQIREELKITSEGESSLKGMREQLKTIDMLAQRKLLENAESELEKVEKILKEYSGATVKQK